VTDFQMGLVVSGVGLTITFFSLGIFIGVIVILQKLFPPKPKEAEGVDEGSQEPVAALAGNSDDSDAELVAALATVAYLRSRRSGQLGASLLAGPGPFRTSRQ
jgi:hypothetical protein